MSNQKKNNSPALASKRDILIISLVVLVLGLWVLWSYVLSPRLFPDPNLQYAWIYHDNDLIEKVALDGEERHWHIQIPDHPEIEMEFHTTADGKIQVSESNCPDKICVNTGLIYMDGQSAACLPNHVIVKIGKADAPGGLGIDG